MLNEWDKKINEAESQIRKLQLEIQRFRTEKKKENQNINWLKKGVIVKVEDIFCTTDYMVVENYEINENVMVLHGKMISLMSTMVYDDVEISNKGTITIRDMDKIERIDVSDWNKLCDRVSVKMDYMKIDNAEPDGE